MEDSPANGDLLASDGSMGEYTAVASAKRAARGVRTEGAEEESVEFVRARVCIVTPTADFLLSGDIAAFYTGPVMCRYLVLSFREYTQKLLLYLIWLCVKLF